MSTSVTCAFHRPRTLWLVAVCLFGFSGGPAAAADEPATKERELAARKEAERLWSRIVAATKKDPREFEDDPRQAWSDIFRDALPVFEQMKRSPERRTMLAFFVEKFGKHGPAADLAWCLVQVDDSLMPSGYAGNALPGRNAMRRGPPAAENRRALQLLLAELKVRHFLAHPKLLARYYDAHAWSQTWVQEFSLLNAIDQAHDHLSKEQPDDEYWWDALNFMILAHATGRDDLLKDVKPEALGERCTTWCKWFEENAGYLEPVQGNWRWKLNEKAKAAGEILDAHFPELDILPDVPFTDWKGPAPPGQLWLAVE